MNPIEIAAQTVGIVGMIIMVLSYQGKSQKSVIAMQLLGNSLFAVNYLLLGALVGCMLNVLGVIRAIVFLFKKQLRADRLPWLVAFICAYISTYIMSFTLFGKEPTPFNLAVEMLPVIGMIALNIGFRLKNASDIRRCALINSPAWLIYNTAVFSVGGILGEVFSLTSIFIGIFRLDKKSK